MEHQALRLRSLGQKSVAMEHQVDLPHHHNSHHRLKVDFSIKAHTKEILQKVLYYITIALHAK